MEFVEEIFNATFCFSDILLTAFELSEVVSTKEKSCSTAVGIAESKISNPSEQPQQAWDPTPKRYDLEKRLLMEKIIAC